MATISYKSKKYLKNSNFAFYYITERFENIIFLYLIVDTSFFFDSISFFVVCFHAWAFCVDVDLLILPRLVGSSYEFGNSG